MRRRSLVLAIGGAIASPGTAIAQGLPRHPRLCALWQWTPTTATPFMQAFLEGLHENGWVDGRNLRIESHWANGRLDVIEKLAAELPNTGCDMIFASGLTSARALMVHTTTIPIVSALLHDPVAEKMAKSWSRPGGNITGTSTLNHDLVAKRVQIVRELVPSLRTLAYIYTQALPNLRHAFDAVAASSAGMGIRTVGFELANASDIEPVFANIKQQRCEAVIVPAYPAVSSGRKEVASVAARLGIAAFGEFAEFAIDGGLASYGPAWQPLFRRSAAYVDRILRGAKAGDLPIEQPTHYELVLNRRTAAIHGIRFPQAILLRADRVID